MKNRGLFIALITFFVLNLNTGLLAQRVSAEFISSLKPPSLVSGQKVKDGVQNVTFHNNTLYVISVWAGIQIVDVSDMTNPKEIGRYQNDHRARNLFIDNQYGYLSDEIEGIHILDLSNPKSVVRKGKIETEGDAWWVEANYPYVYVAEEEKGVRVYDITDIANPVALSVFDTPGWAWGLRVQNNLVYVADKTGGLQVIDFSDKSNPVRIGQFREPKNAKSIYLEDNTLYLTDGPNGLYILDVSNPKFPAVINKINTDGYIYDVFKSGKYAYMANESNQRLDIVNLTSLENPITEASYQADNKIFGVWKHDVFVFVAANNNTLILRHNSPPVLAPIDSQMVNEQLLLTVKADGYDPDGDQVYFEIKNLPEGASFDSIGGVLTWTPTYDQSGIYENVTVRVIERTATKLYTDQSFVITVNHVNRPPSLPEVENFSIDENGTLTFTISEGSDPDIEDKGRLTYLVENAPQGVQFDSLSRTFTWTPTYEQSGTYVMDFVVKDPPGALDRDASTITVVHVDRKPQIDPLADYTGNENTTIEIAVSGTDPDQEDQNKISFSVQNLPPGAQFDPGTKMFSWTPNYDQSGEYRNILFIMTAGALTDTASINITVTHISRPPVLAKIENQTIEEAQTLSFMISGSDQDDEDQNNLRFSVANLPQGAAFNADSLKFTWTPDYDQSGTYSGVVFTVTDVSGLEASQSIDISVSHVNRAPSLEDILPVTADENTPVTITISGSDPDTEDQEKINYTVKNMPEGATFTGTTFSWTPGFDQSGEYVIEYTVTDGQLSDTKTGTVTINHVNRPPTLDPVEPKTVDENIPIEFNIVGGDPDLEDNGLWKISYDQLPEGAVFNAETGSFSWTPSFEQSGVYTVNFTNTDAQGLTATQQVQITVNHVNRTPVLQPVADQTGDENTPITVVIPAAQDPDKEDADKLAYSAQNLPEGASFDPATRILSWTPTFEQAGNFEIQVLCSDGEFSVTQPIKVTINNINRPPTISDIPGQSADENQAFSLQIDYQDPDPEDADKLQITATNLPQGALFDAATATIQWTPNFDQAGDYTGINITVTDVAGAQATKAFNITVINVNRPPTIDESTQLNVTENSQLSHQFTGNDPDQQDQGKLSFSAQNLPPGATLDPASGAFSWTPGFTDAGEYNLAIQVTDPGGLSAESSTKITVENLNRPPTLQPVDNKSINENSPLQVTMSTSDEDTDDQLKYSAEGLPSGADIDENSGTITWTPDFDQAGNYPVIVKVSDGTTEATTSFSITVNNVNRPPQISGGGSVTVEVGETAEMDFSASDPDNDQLSFDSSDLPPGATLNSATGQFSWTPGTDQTGTFNFTVRVSDGSDTVEQSGSVTVNEPPAPPAPPENQN